MSRKSSLCTAGIKTAILAEHTTSAFTGHKTGLGGPVWAAKCGPGGQFSVAKTGPTGSLFSRSTFYVTILARSSFVDPRRPAGRLAYNVRLRMRSSLDVGTVRGQPLLTHFVIMPKSPTLQHSLLYHTLILTSTLYPCLL